MSGHRHKSESDGADTMDSLKDMNKTTRELTAELSRVNNELESLTEQIQNEQKNLRGSLSLLTLFFVFYWGYGFYFWNRPVSDVKFTGSAEVSVVIGIGLFIGIPIFYVRAKRQISALAMERTKLEERKQQLEEILNTQVD